MEQQQPGIRLLRKNEIRTAVQMLAASFDDDPLFNWLACEDPKKRSSVLRWFHESALNECIGVDGVFTLDEDNGAERAVMATIPPGHWPLSWFRTFASIVIP